MSIKVALLKTNEQVISDVKELVSDDKPVAYLFEKPHVLDINKFSLSEDKGKTSIEVTLSPWILVSEDDKIPVSIDHVITLVEPIESVKKMYLEKTNGRTSNQTDSSIEREESDKSD